MPSTTFNPGGGGIGGDWRFPAQQVDERLLPAPSLATVLSKAVGGGGRGGGGGGGGAGASRPGASQAQQPAAPFNPFVQVTAPNSDPTGRYRPQLSALDLSGLFGGGGRGAPAPSAPAPTSAPAGRAALRAPPGNDWTFDAEGNPVPTFPTSMSPDELSRAISKPGWYRRLG